MIYTASWSNRFEIKQGRWVYNPTTECRAQGSDILKELNTSWKKPEYYYHLREGGHVAALNVHKGSKYFATLDLCDFYGSISRSRVTRALKPIIGYERARKIAKISTVKAPSNYPYSHYLPYGFVQSPILASICLLDSYLGKLIDSLHDETASINISVYMDDIVISSNDEEALVSTFSELELAAYKSKFALSEKKTKQVATSTSAFNIIISIDEMIIEEERFQQLKLVYSMSESKHQRHGIGSYVGTVNKQQARLLDEV
ncbi:reverse transcriptase domain-containing protein [Vibrio parahaemolyticus]